ncbi:MAG: thioredoxin domain-containing protein [Acidobacteria bacterium]|nr:thioredoxin domain-containing protein [Acidobacteriota bacterium]
MKRRFRISPCPHPAHPLVPPEKGRRWPLVRAYGLGLCTLAFVATLLFSSRILALPASDGPVATVGKETISASELAEAARGLELSLRAQEYQMRRQLLDSLVETRLLEIEARSRRITVEALLKAEVESKAKPVAETEVDTAMRSVGWGMAASSPAETRERVRTALRRERESIRRAEFLASLRAKTSIRVLLDPPRVALDTSSGPSKGSRDARVTIVAFTDFECSYCGQASKTLHKLQEKHGSSVRLVLRNLPLPMHTKAPKAAEAALCAGEDGKFWEMHDRLFANQGKLAPEDLKEHAAAIGLDRTRFGQCLDSGKHAAGWKRDMEEARRLGVTVTPSLFVNGRFIAGALSPEELEAVVTEELERAAPAALRAASSAQVPAR